MRIIQNEGEEIQVLLDYNEALELLRIMHKKYASNENSKKAYERWLKAYGSERSMYKDRVENKIKKFERIMSDYFKYETTYQLLFKSRRKKIDEQAK